MTAPDREPRDGREAAFLAICRTFEAEDPRRRRALIDAMTRLTDGQPIEDCLTELAVELGYPPGVAREKARNAILDRGESWREALN
jgi:hypothetical protein